jgi:hypothetical protein
MGIGRGVGRAGSRLGVSLVSALVCLGLFAVPALALEGYEPGTPASFGGPGSGAGQLEAPEGVAVNDTTGDVYVADTGNDRIDEFEPDGVFVRAWGWGVGGGLGLETCTVTCQKGVSGSSPGEFVTPAFIAVDNSSDASAGDVYVSDPGDNIVTKFTAVGALVTSWGTAGQLKEAVAGEPFVETEGVAVDRSGDLWLVNESHIDEFTEPGSFVLAGSFEIGERGRSLALDSQGAVYLTTRGGEAYKFESGIELPITEGVTAVATSPSDDDVSIDKSTSIELYTPFTEVYQKSIQIFPATGLVESHGLAVSPTTLYASQRLADTVEVFSFGPLKPIVERESVSGVGSSGATLHGQVRPQGAVTSYFFEYGTSTGYEFRTPVESAGGGTGAVSVSAIVEGPNGEGLQPDTAYYFRLVAINANGERQGSGGMFSTFPVGLLGLPDGRGYELVSPLEDGNATVVLGGGPVRAAADGSALAYQATAPPVGGNGNSGNEERGGVVIEGDNEYLSERSTDGGWTAADVQPDGLRSAAYVAFSSDLSVGILGSEQALLPGAPNGAGFGIGPTGLYVREGGGSYRLLGENAGYAGSTPDGSHVLVSSGAGGLYETSGGELEPVNVLPEGGSAVHAVFGAPERQRALYGGQKGTLSPAFGGPDFSQCLSSEGSHVFWTETDGEGHPLRLFVSEGVGTSGERTVQLDASRVAGEPGGGGRFSTASADGSRVFFTDCERLTANSTAVPPDPTAVPPTAYCEREEPESATQSRPVYTPAGDDLYEYDLATGTLTDLTVASAGEHANVVGVLGASGDGSYVYFAAGGALASGAQRQECVQPSQGSSATKCNIYVVHDGGSPQFVATVTSVESSTTSASEWDDWATSVGAHSAYVAPGGGQLVFDSTLDLTAFDSGGVNEIYMFTPGSGISCVSCNPSGTAAVTVSGSSAGARLSESGSATYALRDVSADGDQVFFETTEGLVPQDRNGLSDVYEWERDGSGSCGREKGCLYLLSGGTSSDVSAFMDASESGDDVFIETRSDLVPQDHSEAFAIYDVRVGATLPPGESECTGTGCQGVPAAPPIFSTPSSTTFNGVGNFPPPTPVKKTAKKTVKCAKGKKLSKGRCVKLKAKARRKAKRKAAPKRKAGKSSVSSSRAGRR